MWKAICIALAASLLATQASAEIFKCAGKNGTVLLQNFPCELDSIGWKPDAQNTQASSGTSNSSSVQPKALPVGVGSAGKTPTSSEPRIGMTAEEVKALWGEPGNEYYDELVDGRVEIWSYAGSRSVTFDVKRRVSAVQY
jgi:hypothetical protein